MPYLEDRIAHGADSHVMEPHGWYEPFMAPSVMAELGELTGPRNERDAFYADNMVDLVGALR